MGPPASIAGYAVIRELGRGTTGTVYEARHPVLNRRVAPKGAGPGGRR